MARFLSTRRGRALVAGIVAGAGAYLEATLGIELPAEMKATIAAAIVGGAAAAPPNPS